MIFGAFVLLNIIGVSSLNDTTTDTQTQVLETVQEKTPEQLAAENAEIQKKVYAAIEEAGPQNTETPAPSTFEQQVTERYSVTMTESEAFSEICDAAHMYIADGATNLQARGEVRAYADYLAPKTGNPSLRTQLAQHGINCLY